MPQADYLLNELLGELATPEPAKEIVVGTCQDEFDHDYVENDVNDYNLDRPTTTSTATTGSLPMVGLVRLLFRLTCLLVLLTSDANIINSRSMTFVFLLS